MFNNYNFKTKNITINGDITFFTIDIVLIFLYISLLIFTTAYTKIKINREGLIHEKYIGDILYVVHTLGTLCLLTLFSCISLLLFSIYNRGNCYNIDLKLYKKGVIIINLVVYFIVFSMIFYELMFSLKEMKSFNTLPYSKPQKAIQFFVSVIYLFFGVLSFFIGDMSLFKIVKEFNRDDGYYINSFTKFKFKFGKVLIFSMLYFFVRFIITITLIFTPIEQTHGIFEIIFYSLFEILPISLAIWIIDKLENEAIELKDSNEEPDKFSHLKEEEKI